VAEVRQTARDAGCVDFVAKPVMADVLFAKLQRHAGAASSARRSHEPPPPTLAPDDGTRNLASRLRRPRRSAASSSSMPWPKSCRSPATSAHLGRRIAALTAAFDYDALLRLAASLETHHESSDGR
jgi:hypothetical protein